MKKKIFYLLFSLIIFIPLVILLIPKEEETELSKLEKNNMLAYTIDGASASSMPTKGSGYVVNSITCKNGSELVWDNDNWKVEIVKIENFDSCIIDFTKDLTKSSPRVTLTQSGTKVVNFDYTGAVQTFTAPVTGSYKLEVWGAQGGSYSTYYGGAGGYSVGTVSLTAGETLYIYVGGQPVSTSATTSAITGGFNGGGQARVHSYSGTTTYSQAGGGATDIRIGQDSLYARVIVAGGGGGSASVNALTTKYGGGTTGGSPSSAFAASQTAGGTNGTFGVGANGYISGYNYKYASGGGGGGWYGGGAVNAHSDSATDYQNQNGGGSGYVYTSSTASNYPSGVLLNSNYYLTNASTIAGNASMPTTDGTGTETGHTGNGYAKITYSLGGSVNLNEIDSSTKTSTSGGSISFYINKKYQINSITGCTATTSDNKITISNVTSNITCNVDIDKILPVKLADVIISNVVTSGEGIYNENGYRYEGSNPNNYIQLTNKSTNTNELWRIIGLFPEGTNGENVIRIRKYYTQNNYPKMVYDSNCANHWPNTTMYTTLSETYSLANYSHTVDFKIYLGTSDVFYNYSASSLYEMERTLNNKGTAGYTSKNSYSSSTSAIGNVGLLYPSDYGFGVIASDCSRSINPYSYNTESSCYEKNWLYQGNTQWALFVTPSTQYAWTVIFAMENGGMNQYYNNGSSNCTGSIPLPFSPVMALENTTKVSGKGTISDPYIIE